jgi:hypothetical protein
LIERQPPPGLVHHSDRGVQYASHAYTEMLKQHRAIVSMSRKVRIPDDDDSHSELISIMIPNSCR